MMRPTLSDIASTPSPITHKVPLGTNFTPRVEPFLEPIRDLATSVLELGVDNGGSLKMWRIYFPNAEIYGVDLKKECKQYERDRIHIRLGNTRSDSFLKDLAIRCGPFDVIIDDGDNERIAQLQAFKILWPYLKKGGFYLIENTATSYTCGVCYSDGLMGHVKDWVDAAQLRGWTIQGRRGKGVPPAQKYANEYAAGKDMKSSLSKFDAEIYSVYVSLNLVIVEKAGRGL